MDLDDWNSPTTKLLTLLNVSAAKSLKRKVFDHQGSPTKKQKLNKRRVEIASPDSAVQVNDEMKTIEPEVGEAEKDDGSGDVGISEAADLSDTEGVLHLLSRKLFA
jgi:U3 small nucleolar RNA-associated protein 25